MFLLIKTNVFYRFLSIKNNLENQNNISDKQFKPDLQQKLRQNKHEIFNAHLKNFNV